MKTFDYKHIEAEEGWELVSVCPTSSSEFGIEIVTAFLKKENAS